MATSRRLSHLFPLGAAGACLALLGGHALAQHTVREVVVEAPQVVHTQLGRTSSGGIDEVVSVDHRVRYSDLDLSKSQDVVVLHDRVRTAARVGCEQLKRLYPLSPHDPDCVKKAVAHAMSQVRAGMGAR